MNYYINLGQLGYPEGVGEGDWDTLRGFIEDQVFEDQSGWKAVYLASLSYLNDSWDYTSNPPAKTGEIPGPRQEKVVGIYDFEWGKKVMAHALCGWQCWEDGQYEIDLWSETGMSCIPFLVEETPSFFFEISWEYGDLIFLPVTNGKSSWGALKCQYR